MKKLEQIRTPLFYLRQELHAQYPLGEWTRSYVPTAVSWTAADDISKFDESMTCGSLKDIPSVCFKEIKYA